MHCDVVGLDAFDFGLRIILARLMGVPFVVNVVCMHLDDRAADAPGFRVPRHKIADFEPLHHRGPALPTLARRAGSDDS